MKLTILLDILNVQPHLSTDAELLDAVKLIIDAEKMDRGERYTVIAAFENGPLWDGDVPSKSSRDKLINKGYIAKVVVKKAQDANITDGSVKALSQKITVAEAVVKDVKVKDTQVETMNRTLEYTISLVEKSINK